MSMNGSRGLGFVACQNGTEFKSLCKVQSWRTCSMYRNREWKLLFSSSGSGPLGLTAAEPCFRSGEFGQVAVA